MKRTDNLDLRVQIRIFFFSSPFDRILPRRVEFKKHPSPFHICNIFIYFKDFKVL